jgi:hypothetical protein
MTRYRSRNPILRRRQESVFASQRLHPIPGPSGFYRVISRTGQALTDEAGGSYDEASTMARVMGNGAVVVPVTYPTVERDVAERMARLRPRRAEAWDLERSQRRAEARRVRCGG